MKATAAGSNEIKMMSITIEIEGQKLTRNYVLTDGQAPEGMGEYVQEMVDALLDQSDPLK